MQSSCGRHDKLRVRAERLAENLQETSLMKASAPFTSGPTRPNHEVTRASKREIDVNSGKPEPPREDASNLLRLARELGYPIKGSEELELNLAT